ncbi:MAG: hypothetical protein KDA22_11685 [Phycisphaerales bacterium]|nr:hypothetical protein [Phycisphaerales bacterium]
MRPALRLVVPEENVNIPFPNRSKTDRLPRSARRDGTDSVDSTLLAMDDVSRRMEDLARQLGCLGFFGDGGDGPRAA